MVTTGRFESPGTICTKDTPDKFGRVLILARRHGCVRRKNALAPDGFNVLFRSFARVGPA
jgi:hypothetical protein